MYVVCCWRVLFWRFRAEIKSYTRWLHRLCWCHDGETPPTRRSASGFSRLGCRQEENRRKSLHTQSQMLGSSHPASTMITGMRAENRSSSEVLDATALRQQRRLKQAIQFLHRDSADLLPLDGLKKLGTSKQGVSLISKASCYMEHLLITPNFISHKWLSHLFILLIHLGCYVIRIWIAYIWQRSFLVEWLYVVLPNFFYNRTESFISTS